ncbi:MAG: cysteine--tRNA ligase [Candidatus Nanohalobium sp.]
MVLKLYNTLEREKQEFKPKEEGKVTFYSCGQTIYDDLHIGNARAYVVWDTLKRYLRHKNYTVRHVQNITDVGHLTDDGDQGEDKVEKRAKKLGLEPMELVESQIERYFEDTKALNIERQDIVPRATGHINEMIEYVQKIYDNGYAYEVDGNIYFDVEAFAEDYPYGEMAKKDLEQLKEEAKSRVEPDDKKKNQYDFALWLNAEGSDHLMKWTAKFEIDGELVKSVGYPGWHIECSVMSQQYLGDEFDIHAGGKDHIFPHHPNERAQAFAASGKGQARYWLHNEFIQVEGEKMSKSEGNFYMIRDLLEEGFTGNTIRLYLLSSHYRSETNFSIEGLEKAEKELKRIKKTLRKIEKFSGTGKEALKEEKEKFLENFEKAMDDDLNTAKAKQALMQFIKEVNAELENGNNGSFVKAREYILEALKILGITFQEDEKLEGLMDSLLELREDAREREDYETSDFIRDRLEGLGFEVEDTDRGAVWVEKN